MKLEITKHIAVKETIDVTFPIYYKEDALLDDVDWVTYGKIDEATTTVVVVWKHYGHGARQGFELEIERTNADRVGKYMTDKYKSTEAEFLAATAKLLKAVEGA